MDYEGKIKQKLKTLNEESYVAFYANNTELYRDIQARISVLLELLTS